MNVEPLFHCCKCKELKLPTEFNKNNTTKRGRQYVCKTCMKTWRDLPENKAYQRQYHQRTEIAARARKRTLENYHNKRAEILAFLGGKCVRCPVTDVRCLHIDHINGGGCRELRSINSSHWKLANMVHQNPEKYQLLCANCNWIKKHENGEVSHGRLSISS